MPLLAPFLVTGLTKYSSAALNHTKVIVDGNLRRGSLCPPVALLPRTTKGNSVYNESTEALKKQSGSVIAPVSRPVVLSRSTSRLVPIKRGHKRASNCVSLMRVSSLRKTSLALLEEPAVGLDARNRSRILKRKERYRGQKDKKGRNRDMRRERRAGGIKIGQVANVGLKKNYGRCCFWRSKAIDR